MLLHALSTLKNLNLSCKFIWKIFFNAALINVSYINLHYKFEWFRVVKMWIEDIFNYSIEFYCIDLDLDSHKSAR